MQHFLAQASTYLKSRKTRIFSLFASLTIFCELAELKYVAK